MPRITNETKVTRALIRAVDVAEVNLRMVAYQLRHESVSVQVRLVRLGFHLIEEFADRYEKGEFAHSDEVFEEAQKAHHVMDYVRRKWGGF